MSDYSAANSIITVFIFLFALIGFVITILGIISIIRNTSTIFGDDGGSSRHSPLGGGFGPRVLPKQSINVTGDSAKLIGCIYLFLGLVMLLIVLFIYKKTGFVFIQ